MPAGIRIVDSSSAKIRRRRYLRIAFFVGIIFLMANLGAIVDLLLHSEIGYFDEEHLIVGGVTALVSALLFGALFIYSDRLEQALALRRRDQELLERSEQKYRNIFESAKDAVFIISMDGRFLEINPAAVRMLGYDSREELLQLDIAHDLYAYYEDWITRQRMMERNGFVENYEAELVRKDGGHIFVLETSTAVYDELGHISAYRGSFKDVTLQREMEAQLQQAQKMESIGRMAGGLAHDFNNYLTTIGGQTEIVMGQIDGDDPLRQSMLEIRKTVEKATSLTKQLLLFSRGQPLNLRPVDVNSLIGGMQKTLSQTFEQHVCVNFEPAGETVLVEADPGNLEQVILNVALYSREAMSGGGELDLSTGSVTIDEEYAISHPEAYPGDFAFIEISDNGNGLDEEAAAHVFEPFFTGEHDRKAGMDLAVAYGIVMQHGGWIEVSSEPEAGTTFRIYLPASVKDAGLASTETDGSTLRGHGERILLVEDEEAVRTTIERMLKENGYTVLTAPDAEKAFDIFVSEAGNIHLVFSDVVLPGESGVELAEHLRSHRSELPVILSSGYADRVSDLDTIIERDYRFLQKPFSLPDLLKAVREVMGPSVSLS